jgi:hypothetical protein
MISPLRIVNQCPWACSEDDLLYNDGEKMDTIPTAVVQWKKAISRNEKTKQTEKLGELLKIQIDTEKL